MSRKNQFEKLEIILRGLPHMSKHTEQIINSLTSVNNLTIHRLLVPVMDGYGDAYKYKENLLNAKDHAKKLAEAMNLVLIDMPHEKRILLLREVLDLLAEWLLIYDEVEYDGKILKPITELFSMPHEIILNDNLLYYNFWLLSIKSGIIKSIMDAAAFYDLPLAKIITITNDKEGLSGLWAAGKTTFTTAPFKKLKWLGKQKELADLVITLESKGWIEKIGDGFRVDVCRALLSCFDISDTKKSAETKELESFLKILKPETDPKTKDRSYPGVYTNRYIAKFKDMKINTIKE